MENKVPISLIGLIRTLNKYFNTIIMHNCIIANIINIDENNIPVYYMGANYRIYPIQYTYNDKNIYLKGINKHVNDTVNMKEDKVIITEIK